MTPTQRASKALVDFQAAAVIPAIVRRLLARRLCRRLPSSQEPLQRVDVARPRRGVQRIHVHLDQLDDGRMAERCDGVVLLFGVVPSHRPPYQPRPPGASNRRAVSTSPRSARYSAVLPSSSPAAIDPAPPPREQQGRRRPATSSWALPPPAGQRGNQDSVAGADLPVRNIDVGATFQKARPGDAAVPAGDRAKKSRRLIDLNSSTEARRRRDRSRMR